MFISIVTVFLDIIFGYTTYTNENDYKLYICENNPLIEINKWLLANGLFGYLGLITFLIIKKISMDDFSKKVVKVFHYVTHGFCFFWSIIGIYVYFKYYYGINKCIHINPFLYYYSFIRLIFAPIIYLYKIIEFC
jgi:hypothetical protein